MAFVSCFEVDWKLIRGFHVYEEVWEPIIGEILLTIQIFMTYLLKERHSSCWMAHVLMHVLTTPIAMRPYPLIIWFNICVLQVIHKIHEI